ncbi:hypothetical protein Tco_1248024, partial [Tanacetum coccineum]
MTAPVPVTSEVGVAVVASPVGVLELDTYSSSKANPLESSPPPVSVAPMVSPFLCSDDSESRVASRSLSPTTSTLEIPTAPILPAPSTVVAPSSEFPLGIDREEVDHLLSRHSISGHSLSGHASPDTTIVDSSTPPRFVYPPLTRTPRCSEAYLHWRSAPLSTMYLPTTSELSAEDSSSESSVGPSRKRCRSSAATVTSSIHATRALLPYRADLLPLRKMFRDSISLDDIDRDVKAGIDAGIGMEVDVGVDVEDEVEDEVESSDKGTMEVGVDVVAGINIPDGMRIPDVVEHLEQRELEARSLIAGGERASLLEQVAS